MRRLYSNSFCFNNDGEEDQDGNTNGDGKGTDANEGIVQIADVTNIAIDSV